MKKFSVMSNLANVKKYDVVVIGSGGGAKISTPSSNLGYKVALCEKDRLGGTCLNRGCIPSKMLIHPADVARTIESAHRFNIESSPPKVNFPELVDRVSKVIDEESFSINPKIEANSNIDWYKKHVKFVAPKILQVGDNQNELITGDKIFIAAGTRPHIPNIEGLSNVPYMTSTEALRLTKQPKKLIVIGGGYIACELSHYFASLGTEVNMLVRSSLIRHVDSEVAAEFTKLFCKQSHLNVILGSVPNKISYDKESDQFSVQYPDPVTGKNIEIQGDNLLVATGVVPNSDQLDCKSGGLEVDGAGFIKVDKYLKTNVDGVYAFGDIAGNYLFRHSANFEGEYLMEVVVRRKELEKEGGKVYEIDYTGMPYAVFASPQVASVGETEDELKKRGASYVKGVNKYSSSAMGMALRSEGGFVKLLIERKTRRILGCHIVGDEASVLIHQICPLMRLKGTLDDILYTIHIHPALSELVRNAARLARNALVEAGDEIPLRLKLK